MQNRAPICPDFKYAHDEVLIRPLAGTDWAAFKDWARYINQHHKHGPEAAARIEAQPDDLWQRELSHDKWKFFAAFDQGKIISLGRVTTIGNYAASCEVNVDVAADRQGAGIGTRMCSAMKDYIAHQYPGYEMIGRILADNAPSRRSAEKAGLKYIGRSERPVPPKTVGYMVYSVSAQELALSLSAPGAAP